MVICWDVPNHAGHSRKISFPSSLTKKGSLRSKSTATTDIGQSFEELLQACAPATFGLKKRDVLDENYRKAGKMDREQFAVDFHPHDHGIIDAVGQILLPEIRTTFLKDREEHRGVVAELYKLNVRSSRDPCNLEANSTQDLLWTRGQVQDSRRHSPRLDTIWLLGRVPPLSPRRRQTKSFPQGTLKLLRLVPER